MPVPEDGADVMVRRGADGRPAGPVVGPERIGEGQGMHELSICESIARAVTAHADGRRVRSVQLRVGALRQVVPDTLVFCWSLAARDPLLQGSVLEVELVPARVACADCGLRDQLSRFVLTCPSCGGAVTVEGGEELDLVALEVDDPPGDDADRTTPPPAGEPATTTGVGGQ